MKLHFAKADPSGNTTVLILDEIDPARYTKIAAAVMSHTGVGAEQVGFVVPDPAQSAGCRLEMAGGEFCGNAARSFAAWVYLFRRERVKDWGADGPRLSIRISGCDEELTVRLRDLGEENRCYGAVDMPKPQRILTGTDEWFGGYTLVVFQGISHIILSGYAPRAEDVEEARRLLEQFGPLPDAFGLMYYEESAGFLRPLVYVETGNTLVWENSCGSGSSALACALAAQENRSLQGLVIRQPGGELNVDVEWRDGVERLVLGGAVAFTAAGELYV